MASPQSRTDTPGTLASPGVVSRPVTVSPYNTVDTSTTESPVPDIDWEKVDEALAYFQKFDVLDLASIIVNKAAEKGPKDIYNEAGSVRFKIAQAKQMYNELASSICRDSLEQKEAMIEALERKNAAKSWARTERG